MYRVGLIGRPWRYECPGCSFRDAEVLQFWRPQELKLNTVLSLVLAACTVGPAANEQGTAELATAPLGEPAPPPGEPLTLEVADPDAGGRLELVVGNADPGESVYYVLSPVGTGVGPCPDPLGGLCVGLAPPLKLFTWDWQARRAREPRT